MLITPAVIVIFPYFIEVITAGGITASIGHRRVELPRESPHRLKTPHSEPAAGRWLAADSLALHRRPWACPPRRAVAPCSRQDGDLPVPSLFAAPRRQTRPPRTFATGKPSAWAIKTRRRPPRSSREITPVVRFTQTKCLRQSREVEFSQPVCGFQRLG